jgi:hypothetical protein
VDLQPFNGTNYYRLKQVDRNGKSRLYPIVAVKGPVAENRSFDISPNPNNGSFRIEASGLPQGQVITVKIIGGTGRIVMEKEVWRQPNETAITIQTDLSEGIYYADISTASFRQLKKLVIQ